MGASDTLVAKILENVGSLIPIRLVHNYEQGVKFSYGRPVKLCTSDNGLPIRFAPKGQRGTGLHLFMPFFESIEVDDTALERPVDLANQSYRTLDDESVAFQATIAYRIENLQTVWETVHNVEKSIKDIAEGIVGPEISRHRAADLFSLDARLDYGNFGPDYEKRLKDAFEEARRGDDPYEGTLRDFVWDKRLEERFGEDFDPDSVWLGWNNRKPVTGLMSVQGDIIGPLQEAAAEWGIEVTKLLLPTCVDAKTYRVINGDHTLITDE